jgi:hypothetical protein
LLSAAALEGVTAIDECRSQGVAESVPLGEGVTLAERVSLAERMSPINHAGQREAS